MQKIYQQVSDKLSSGLPLIIVTVVRTRGSTPQKPGSTAIFDSERLVAGTVGGGVTEGTVQMLAMKAIDTMESGLYDFDLANDISNKEEAICGGEISVLLDASPADHIGVFEQIVQDIGNWIPGVLVTLVKQLPDHHLSVIRYWMTGNKPLAPADNVNDKIVSAAEKLLSGRNQASFLEIGSSPEEATNSVAFLQPIFPREKLIIAGAGHIGRALAHLGSLLNFEVTVVDDRPEFANVQNIPDADHLVVKDIGEAMDELADGENTYSVIVTRGHKDDALALRPCIGRNLAYTGMIGSKIKVATMRSDFLSNGWATASQWERIHTPIGLAINSQTVEEIAVSIAAELILVRNSRH
jgi:xanthine dehydrogenase accessory factor